MTVLNIVSSIVSYFDRRSNNYSLTTAIKYIYIYIRVHLPKQIRRSKITLIKNKLPAELLKKTIYLRGKNSELRGSLVISLVATYNFETNDRQKGNCVFRPRGARACVFSGSRIVKLNFVTRFLFPTCNAYRYGAPVQQPQHILLLTRFVHLLLMKTKVLSTHSDHKEPPLHQLHSNYNTDLSFLY